MRSALFGAAFSAVFFSGFGAHAQGVDNGVFEKFLGARSPQCVPVKAFDSVSKVTELSPAQFEFVRALYVTLPPMSRQLPPGDRAVVAKADGVAMLALVGDGQACARFLAPGFILSMLDEVGRGRAIPLGTPAVVHREVSEPYHFLPQIHL